ncbi:hypothetical protein UYO_0055 [Lachnospiraceae bacterium JC7]|nr:hypothetical protein UYO_0055 [Lachnospiraceae bacterium JC7]
MERRFFRPLRLVLALALSISLFSLTAYAGWEYDYGKWYYYDDYTGYYVSDQWVGNYYVGSDGTMLTNAWTPDGYYVGSDGEWTGQTAYGTSYGASYQSSAFVTSPGLYTALTYYSGYDSAYVDSVTIDGNILTVVGSLDYSPDQYNWQYTTRMAPATYYFQLTSGTEYLIVEEQAYYISKAEFDQTAGPVLSIVVENGLVKEVYYSA